MLDVLDMYGTFLKPFKELTTLCQSSSVPTLPLIAQHVIPIVMDGDESLLLHKNLDSPLIMSVKHQMQIQFRKFYKDSKLLPILAAAAFLNPFYANHMHKLGVDDELQSLMV